MELCKSFCKINPLTKWSVAYPWCNLDELIMPAGEFRVNSLENTLDVNPIWFNSLRIESGNELKWEIGEEFSNKPERVTKYGRLSATKCPKCKLCEQKRVSPVCFVNGMYAERTSFVKL